MPSASSLILATLVSSAVLLASAPSSIAAPTPAGHRHNYFAAATYARPQYAPPKSDSSADYNEEQYDIYKAVMCGEKEIPLLPELIGQPAFGNAVLVVRKSDQSAMFEASHFNTAPVSALHIHGPADTAHNASVIFPILPTDPSFKSTTENPIRNSPNTTPIQFDAEKLEQLAKGLLYVNVHTTEHPGGALRGQLLCASKHCSGADESQVARFSDDGICNRAIFGGSKTDDTYSEKKGDDDKSTGQTTDKYNDNDNSNDDKYDQDYKQQPTQYSSKKSAAYAPSKPHNNNNYADKGDTYDDQRNAHHHHASSKYNNQKKYQQYSDDDEDDYSSNYSDDDSHDYSYSKNDGDSYVPAFPSYARPSSSSYRHGHAAAASYNKPSYDDTPSYNQKPTYNEKPSYSSGYSNKDDDKSYGGGGNGGDCQSALSFFKDTGSPTLAQCAQIACDPRQSADYTSRALYQCYALMQSAKANNHGRIPSGW
ncbi:hypothetical protein HDU87_008587 [Geranomyces variabilis]|uniref:CHRD domain-containing protein n=1 Tax=Geranomyces variabilis TaxID=109894 RepID=A0AAD5TNW2_9FUNG|nr:hypothetical protein HDU87_008587 [Geranomyces variabilis]